jgi:hypothetical protein
MSTSEIATVLAWHDALNAKDMGTLVDLSSDDIDVSDAHGATQGLEALQEWAQGLTENITTGRLYNRDGIVVAEQSTGASAFRVVDDQVTSVFRHPDLAAALEATDLTEDDLDA